MVEIQQIRKQYGEFEVLKGITLEIRAGEVTAIVGPNAAGKSTLLKCLLGLVLPTHGQITVNGQPAGLEWQYRRMIGYMPQAPRFPENLTIEQVLALVADIRAQPAMKERELIDFFGLSPFREVAVRKLSIGTRQKLNAVVAMMFDPRILVLDEPTAGLDPLASSRFKDLVLRMRGTEKTVILTSHHLADVEELADRVVFLLEGTIRFDGSKEELMRHSGEKNLERGIARLMEQGAS